MKTIITAGLTVLLCTGCDLKYLGTEPTSVERQVTLDGVKLIGPGFTNPQDARTFSQGQYSVSDTQRLLLRFENLLERAKSINVSKEKHVYVVVFCTGDGCLDQGVEDLEVCPLTRPWMMLATWNYSHPFGSGRWTAPGGDFDTSSCAPASHPDGAIGDTAIYFDVTSWVINYAQGRSSNYGWVLKSKQSDALNVYGDQSGPFSPRLLFDEYL